MGLNRVEFLREEASNVSFGTIDMVTVPVVGDEIASHIYVEGASKRVVTRREFDILNRLWTVWTKPL